MSSPADLETAIHCLVVGLSNTFTQIVENIVQKQVSLLFQQEREKKMDHWQEQEQREHAHGLPTYIANRSNLASTPPMSLPFIDHHLQSLDQTLATSFGDGESALFGGPGVPSWPSGSSGSSPFRQTFPHHGLPSAEGTVSPRELLSHHHDPHGLSYAVSSNYQDDASMFTFSDSDNSLSALPVPPPAAAATATSTHRRKQTQKSDASARPSQGLTYHEGRRPLPSGPRHSLSSRTFGPPLGLSSMALAQTDLSSTGGVQQQRVPSDFTLPSNNTSSKPPSSRPSKHHRLPSRAPLQGTFPSPLLSPASVPASQSNKAMIPFPPGQDEPNFVPIGHEGVASAAQGNAWPIERELFENLVVAERGHRYTGDENRSHRARKLAYKEILAKYNTWDIKESTLRGIKRKITLPKEHRERVPRWNEEHIDSLCRHVPLNTDRKGKIAWSKVVVAIKRDTGRPFGAGSTSKKWADLTSSGKVNKSHSARELRSQSGGDEGDGEEGESSPDVSGVADVSEEDLPSHKFPSQREEDVELRFFQGTGRTVFW